MLYDRFQLFFSKASSSSSSLIRSIITESGYHVNCFTGYNLHYGHSHVRHFCNSDINHSIIIRSICITFGFVLISNHCCITLHVNNIMEVMGQWSDQEPTVGDGKKSSRLLVHIVIDILFLLCTYLGVCNTTNNNNNNNN